MIEKNLIPKFPGRDFSDIWYNLKISLSNLKKFFWVVWEYREFDSAYSLEILKVSLEGHLNALTNDSNEVDEYRLPKVERLTRALELLNNKLKDDYAERCGYDYDYEIKFEPLKDRPDLFEMVDTKTEAQDINNSKAMKKASKLEKAEWKEFISIIHDDVDWWWT